MGSPIPERIEAGGVTMEKDVLWTTIGFMVGKQVAGLGGGMIGALTQGNSQIFNYRVWFSDGSYTDRSLPQNKALIDLVVWDWRIANKKSEWDYVTLGIDFDSLTWGSFVPLDCIQQYVAQYIEQPKLPPRANTPGYSSENRGELRQSFDELKGAMKDFSKAFALELGLRKIIKQELTRYFKDKEGLELNIWEEKNGYRIPVKSRRTADRPIGFVQAIFIVLSIVGVAFLNVRCQDSYQSSPSYQPSQSSE